MPSLTVLLNLNRPVKTRGKSAFTLVKDMREKIHPQYHTDAKVICSCGNTFTTGSTKKELKVEVCSNCHPFYTGERRMLDTTGRVERFRKRYNVKD